MPETSPFQAVRYRVNGGGLSRLLCPPYDTIGPEQARQLRRGAHNAIHLELPLGGAGRHAGAARLWRRWLDAGVLARDARPSLYIVEHAFSRGGKTRSRVGLFSALHFFSGKSRVIPHERTFKKHRQDRQHLLDALEVNTSPVFLLFPDPSRRVRRALAAAMRGEPLATARAPWGDALRLWAAPDPEGLQRLLHGKPLLIADGHHRFRVSRERAEARGRDEGCLVYLAPDEDAGLLLPTHRVVLPAAPLLKKLEGAATMTPYPSLKTLEAALARAGKGAAAGVCSGEGFFLARPRRAFKGLPVEWVARGLGVDPLRDKVSYTHEAVEAAEQAARTGGVALLLPAPTLKAVRAAVRRAGLLPEKTTYFYPKVPTGLVFRELSR